VHSCQILFSLKIFYALCIWNKDTLLLKLPFAFAKGKFCLLRYELFLNSINLNMVMIRYMILLLLLCFGIGAANAQTTGDLQGKVLDENGEPLPYANVALFKGGTLVRGTSTDFDGLYNFSNMEAGTYDMEVSYVGLPTKRTEGVIIKVGQVMNFDVSYTTEEIALAVEGDSGKTVIVTAFKIPLIEVDNTTSGQTLGSEDIQKLATRSISSIKATTAGVSQKDEGEATNTNGSRSTSDDTYVDGVRVIGGASIPETEIDQIQIITSGVPAEPKLGKAKPLGFGARPVSCDMPVASGTVMSGPAVEAPPPPPPQAAKTTTTDAVAITFKLSFIFIP
jgi:hypothetical protein